MVDYEGEAAHAAAAPTRGPQRPRRRGARLRERRRAAPAHRARPSACTASSRTAATSPNIVLAHAAMQWYVRSDSDPAPLQPLKARVAGRAWRPARPATGCTCTSAWEDRPYAEMRGQRRHAGGLRRQLGPASGGRCGEPDGSSRVVGSTDMGNVSYLVPSDPPDDQGGAATACPSTRRTSPASPAARRGDRAVLDGAKAMAMTVVDLWAGEACSTPPRRAPGRHRRTCPSPSDGQPRPARAIPGDREVPP